MAIVPANPTQGQALFEETQSFYTHDDIADNKSGSTYSHLATEFSATECEAICDWARYINSLLGARSFIPQWVKITVTHTQLQAAALTNSITLCALPAGVMIQGIKVKHSAAFAGPSISAYNVKVGISGTLAKYTAAFDVLQAVAGTTFQVTAVLGMEDQDNPVNLLITATAVGANLDVSTSGSVDVWLLLGKAV